jgi:starch phosphorylase
MIIEEIDRRFRVELDEKYHIYDHSKREKLEIIYDGQVRMANLCIVASHSVNGVAKLHTEILKNIELNDFFKIFPYKFNNKTNGITHRRWLLNCNKDLTSLITEAIGSEWKKDPVLLENILRYKDDTGFLDQLDIIKSKNKVKLAEYIMEHNNIKVNPNSIFDIQTKRLHEYKRQLLNVFHIMHLYNRLLDNPGIDITPRTFIFGAKAAPGYHIAKQIIKLINSLADVVNNDKRINDKIKVVFLENYNVSLAEKIIPAADLSEQISTASKEASGTGNMKFMMNGAITIGTVDGANVEIMEAVGNENIYIFGLNSKEVYETHRNRSYNAYSYYAQDKRIKRIIDQLSNGFLSPNPDEFKSIRDSLLNFNDEFLVLKDFDSYIRAQTKVGIDYMNRYKWLNKSIINIAKAGIFSSDYTVREYAMNIWDLGDESIE